MMRENLNSISEAVIGAAIEVHRVIGPGFLESVYEQALAIEMIDRKIEFERQKIMQIDYKGHMVGEGRLDFLVAHCVVVELKAVDAFHPIHTAQAISYLKATRLNLALLINFNVKILTQGGIKRVSL